MKARLAAALLVLAATPGCDPAEDRARLIDTVNRLEAVCLGPFNVAQSPGGVDQQGRPRQSFYLFAATLHNPRDRPVGAGLRFSMTVTGGGRTVSSPPPYVEFPAGAGFAPAATPGRASTRPRCWSRFPPTRAPATRSRPAFGTRSAPRAATGPAATGGPTSSNRISPVRRGDSRWCSHE